MSRGARDTFLWPSARRERWLLIAILVAGLALRLQVWQWHRLYPLGGDEQEYFDQALTWLRGDGYHELRFMRPPLYPVFLAGVFRLFDSQVQRVRLVQAIISTGTIYGQWLLMRLALGTGEHGQGARLAGAALIGLSYTLAANATELLTETTFLFGLTLVLCLLLAAGMDDPFRQDGRGTTFLAGAAGAGAGLLALVRSVALPLLPLGALWLFFQLTGRSGSRPRRQALMPVLLFLLGGITVIAPWTIRNVLRYDALIVVDTTGPENLWLDNDPAGREAVKAQLYALGDDRGARQALGTRRGVEVIRADPSHFLSKVAGEVRKLVALEYWDDLRLRPSIWVPPLEVWSRLVLGDGIWLILALAGSAGIFYLPARLQWLLLPWVLYVVVTSLIFHVELRYRLPLYPALALAAAVLLAPAEQTSSGRLVRRAGSLLLPILVVALLLMHRPYLSEGAMLARKHWRLWRGDGAGALHADADSALARVMLAEAPARRCRARSQDCGKAETLLREAIDRKPEHPYAHLLLGALLREQGDTEAAKVQLRYEGSSLEDLQRWMANRYGPRGVTRLDIGDGLDLGDITGFFPADDGFRWTGGRATVWLRASEQPAELRLRLRGGPVGGTTPATVRLPGMEPVDLDVGPDWATYRVPVPAATAGTLLPVSVETPVVRPRALDPTSDDNRPLGIGVDWIEIADAE